MITKLAVTSTQVKATVRVGINEFGSYVTTDIVLSRKDDDVSEALVPLENLALRSAQQYLKNGRDRKEIEAAVDAEVAKRLERERARLTRDAQAGAERRQREADQKVSSAEAKVSSREAEIVRLQTTVDDQRGELFKLRNQVQRLEHALHENDIELPPAQEAKS